MITVLVVEELLSSAEWLRKTIATESARYELLGIVSNGIVGRAIVERQNPDIVLISTTSRYFGGLSFISAVSGNGYIPQIVQLYTEEKTLAKDDIPAYAQFSICRRQITEQRLFEVLEQASTALLARKNQEENRRSLLSRRNEAVMELLQRKLTPESAADALRRFHLDLSGGALSIALLYLANGRPMDPAAAKQLVNLFRSVLKQGGGGEVFFHSPNELGLLIRGPETLHRHLYHYFFSSAVQNSCRAAEFQLGLDIRAVWTEKTYSLADIHRGYEHVMRLAKYRYFLPETRILDEEYLKANAVPANIPEVNAQLDTLENAVLKQDHQEAVRILSNLYLNTARASMDFVFLGYLREHLENLFRQTQSRFLPMSALDFSAANYVSLEQESLNMQALFTRLLQELRAPSQVSPVIRQVTRYLSQNYRQDISLDMAAEDVQVSSGYLSRLFRKELDTTFVAYLTGVRIHKARLLLHNPGLKISEVASAVGYQDEKYFCRVFKKMTGATPAEYRKSIEPGGIT